MMMTMSSGAAMMRNVVGIRGNGGGRYIYRVFAQQCRCDIMIDYYQGSG